MINNLLKNTSILLFSQILIMLLSLVSQIIMARLLLPEGRGVYALCVVYSAFMILFTNFGNEFGVRFLLLKKRINISESFLYLIITMSISLVFSIFVLYILDSFFGVNFFNKITNNQLLLALLFTVTNIISRQTNVLLTISKEFKKAAFISFFEEAIKLILMYMFLLQFKSVEAALISVIIGNFIVILFYSLRFKFYLVDLKSIKILDFKYIYKYGLKNFFFSFSNLANGQLSTLILSVYLTNEKIGVYSVAFGLISRFQFIPDTLNRIFVPISNENNQGKNESLKLFSSFLFYLFLMVLIFLLIFSNKIILLLFGEDYIEAGLLLKILSVGFIFKILSKPLEAYYNEIKGRPGIISTINGVALVLLSVSMLIMSKYYGLIGASIASSVVMILAYLVLFNSFLIMEKENGFAFFDLKKIGYFFRALLKSKK